MPKRPIERFRINREKEILWYEGGTNFVSSLRLSHTVHERKEYKKRFNKLYNSILKEKKRALTEMSKLGDSREDFLEKKCMEDHCHRMDLYLGWLKEIKKVDNPQNEQELGHTISTFSRLEKIAGQHFSARDPYKWGEYTVGNLRNAIAETISMEREPDPMGNRFIEEAVDEGRPLLIINDLPVEDSELLELAKSSTKKTKLKPLKKGRSKRPKTRKILVKPFSELSKKLIDHMKELDPDMIILPLRGGYAFYPLIPKHLKKRVHLFNISEHLDPETRFKAITDLLWKVHKESPKKIVWLDDEVFTGHQSSHTQSMIRGSEKKDLEFHTLALAADKPHFFEPPNLFFGIGNKLHARQKVKRGPSPMLASKWVALFTKIAKDRGNRTLERKINKLMKKARKLDTGGV